MADVLPDSALNQLFRNARTCKTFAAASIADRRLEALYDRPTSMNGQPVRFVFVRSPEAKGHLRPSLAGQYGADDNNTLQGARLMMTRALGLASGFDNAAVDAAFFPEISWCSNFLITLGEPDLADVHPRGPRQPFSEACRIV